jgi:hypothetical protein
MVRRRARAGENGWGTGNGSNGGALKAICCCPYAAHWLGPVLSSAAILADQHQRDAIDAAEAFQIDLA